MEFDFRLTGTSPLLMHKDDVEGGDALKEWRDNPENRPLFVPGDDRSPAWTWMTYLYVDEASGNLCIPGDNLMRALCYAGARVTLKGTTTFKSLTQSGLLMMQENCRFLAGGREFPMERIEALRGKKYAEQADAARAMGFKLFVKRAAVGQAKHVRVRARFEAGWNVEGRIAVGEPAITPDVLRKLFYIAGRYAGLGDWRPSSKKSPGPYGMFEAELAEADDLEDAA